MEKQTLEENIVQLHNKIANFQSNFVEASCAPVPSPLAQANAQLEEALQREARTKSRVSELESENNKLQVQLTEKETEAKQVQDQLNTRIKELEAELQAEKAHSEKVCQTSSHLHEQKMDALIQKNQELMAKNMENLKQLNSAKKELEEARRNAGKYQQTNAASCPQQDRTEKQKLAEENQTLKALTKRLQEENKKLKESQLIQEQPTTTKASRQGQFKKEKQKYDNLLKELNKKEEENKALKRENNILKIKNQDLSKERGQTEEVVNRTVDQASKCEGLDAVDMSHQQIQELLRAKQMGKVVCVDQLNALIYAHNRMCAENARLRAELNQHDRPNQEEAVNQTSEDKTSQNQLLEQLKNEERAKRVYKDQVDALSDTNYKISVENVRLRADLKASTFEVLEKFKTANILLNQRLRAEEQAKFYFQKQLDACNYAYHQISAENDKVRAELNQYVLQHPKDKADNEKAQRDIDLLRDELRKANKKSEQLQIQLTTTNNKTQQEKKALESLVDDLKLQLNQEKNEKENGQEQVKKLEQTLEKERYAFTETIKRCFAAYQTAAAKCS
ncbi:hypothetical protein WMY93_001263 [Mugilogobius chulae]|uniref:Uncharacterized protein n=1 Tax=Mugilogobius chulae TaxID=88201 RepID=A0AAW0QCH4_9GOBI